jgi:hypothetical protein
MIFNDSIHQITYTIFKIKKLNDSLRFLFCGAINDYQVKLFLSNHLLTIWCIKINGY